MISVFDLFKIGVGPSSSHTVGPMVAARRFLLHLKQHNLFDSTTKVSVELHGSLALTGKGHATGTAILMGLQGEQPHLIEASLIPEKLKSIIKSQTLKLLGEKEIPFKRRQQLKFNMQSTLPEHPNGITFSAFDQHGIALKVRNYFSVGGGFVLSENEISQPNKNKTSSAPYQFSSCEQLLNLCDQHHLTIPQLVLCNENALRSESETSQGILKLWQVMDECISSGCSASGYLPGGLQVPRRGKNLYQKLTQAKISDNLALMDWINLFALAVNEENAAGGRVVTAPTNGAAGVIPAVLAYYVKFVNPDQPLSEARGICKFMLTATAIGTLFKENASISAAEVGCQGEVGVACSMAAAGLTAVLGGSNQQIENAAEIGMEHNLGLTCDPIKGLVQIPCIERNTMGAVQAINASRLAMLGDGSHKVSLDQVIETMRQTGKDMQEKYKETSQGGLAVNVVEC
ncbi:L-serine ammonia-lyase [Litoribacillus peritrichatus]|uniref:L-serine dehydratase n=2 Tax=Litoribacillus peritrichatus TaxID=718191 RepID=A0ABP7MYW5_9GAMM